jgi:subtilase family serine protease
MLNLRLTGFGLLLLGSLAVGGADASAQATRRLVVAPVDPRQTVELSGNTRSEANAQNDRGLVEDSLPLDHMQLLLKRPEETEAALNQFIGDLSDKSSPLYHQWLSAEEFGAKFGPAKEDVQAVTEWLSSQGFVVNSVHPGGMIIDFSGTAGQIRTAFQTEIHELSVKGATHIANMTDPRIPAALAGVVNGVVSLHDFRPHPNFKVQPQFTFTLNNATDFAVTPGDLATIYNFTPAFNAGISGQGQTVVLIEDSDAFSASDWTTFRSTFGLSSFTDGSLTTSHPAPASGKTNCTDPGVVSGNEQEAELDIEYASAAAPSAAIVLASCADTSTTFGGLIALENLLTESTPPAIVSISFGECEANNGATANSTFSSTYQEAAAAGVSVFVSAGDEGAASCDADQTKATHGIGVSGFASTAFNVAVGGTDFGDTFAKDNSTFWSSTNSSTFSSALSYINEIPWNDSCASALLATNNGFTTSAGTKGFCNSKTGEQDFLTTASGSGGPSGCFSGKASTSGVVSGTCAGNPKPSWQSVLGNPADKVRDLPDVSLFAANGAWNHFYIFCDSDTNDQGGAACTGSPSGWTKAGGTSFGTPIWAGIMALINQKTGTRNGLPTPTLYSLASTEYGTSGSSTCNSSNGASVGSSCIFYDVTQGDMDVNCTGKNSCFVGTTAANKGIIIVNNNTNGILSTSTTASDPAFGTTTGWDFATGIGTVNVTNLVNNF